jgi:16S rRNA (cytidine1402-2'-O)-methyltransferase
MIPTAATPLGRLYLIPVPLSATAEAGGLPLNTLEHVRRLTHFVVEEPKTARRHLKEMGHPTPISQLHLTELNQHTALDALSELMTPLLKGLDVGLMSEAGCPAVADPGAQLVRMAHQQGILVLPLVGPSSLLLALMASGLDGQRFAFQGYLPTEAGQRKTRIEALEKRSRLERETQLCIETPYRNDVLFAALRDSLASATLLCVASDLTGASQMVRTLSVAQWRRESAPLLHKNPTVFLFLAS